MGRGFRIPVVILVLAVAVAALVVLLRPPSVPSASPSHRPGPPRPSADDPAIRPEPAPSAASTLSPVGAPRARMAFDRLLEALRRRDRAAAKEALEDLRVAFSPAPVPEAENAAALYRKAFELYPVGLNEEETALVGNLSEGKALTAAERVVLEKVLEKNREALALLHKAAALPKCDFGVDYSHGFAAELPHVSGMIRAARLLDVEALLSEGAGVTDSARASLRLAESLADEPILVSQLVRGICQAHASEAWQQAFQGDVAPEALRALLGMLSPDRYREGFERSILFELYGGAKLVLEGVDFSTLGPEAAKLRRPSDDPLSTEDFAYYAETLSEFSSLAGRPYYEIRDRLERLRIERVDGAPWYAGITRLVMPALDRAALRQATAEAGVGTGRLAAALRLYRDEHGTYPDSLEAVRGILPGLPVDPFTGKPFLYRREGSGFVVWSVGSDGTDGGGVSAEDDVLFRSPR